ncbi:chromophore lyase CpcT/CpeT [Aerosakkonemataceae cyanobacterium BLCC-F50]|uniref:Chromophore lyase CpcT/CpeT n=1 Tax=Floridaenema flaviceps BLCC-F50 TaxID=3153642 RepID=A0ABV4XNG9_9CYAN
MRFSDQLIALASYMAGEFDNQAQAIADPAWYVHLRLWQRPVPLFTEDSITLFAEQANIVNLEQAYRPRIIRLRERTELDSSLQVQYYMIEDPALVQGAGRDREKLKTLTTEQIEFLPGCTLNVTQNSLTTQTYHFQASLPPDARCCFTYRNETYQVSLGFEATPEHFLSYDKGIDPQTGKAIWGALLGPFRFTKRQDFSTEITL